MGGFIVSRLKDIGGDDPLQACPFSCREMLRSAPDVVLDDAFNEMSKERSHGDNSMRWVRLYEEASLYKVVKILNDLEAGKCTLDDPISEIVEVLDRAIANAVSQWRFDLIEEVFNELGNLLPRDPGELPSPFSISPPAPLNSASLIFRATRPLSFEEFQEHLDRSTTPLRIPGILDRWPALQRWQDAAYFYGMTLGGRRLVPVEIGENYTAADYRSEVMTFRKFMELYVLDDEPEEVGYLAQHDLFTQIRDLQQDIVIPDYCYTSPPIPLPYTAAALTPGMDVAHKLDEPLTHAWLGPKGTKTPLHTDPYHNILCQVVGKLKPS